jgi:hypothetical protein
MIKKFAVFNPNTGTYTMATSEQERNELMAKAAWDTYMYHTNSSPFSNVLITDDGAEQWSNSDGTPTLPSAETSAELDATIAQWSNILKVRYVTGLEFSNGEPKKISYRINNPTAGTIICTDDWVSAQTLREQTILEEMNRLGRYSILAEIINYDTGSIILCPVDQDGNPIMFDQDGNVVPYVDTTTTPP